MRPEDLIEFLLTRAEFAEEKAHTVNDHLARFTWELISEGYRHLPEYVEGNGRRPTAVTPRGETR